MGYARAEVRRGGEGGLAPRQWMSLAGLTLSAFMLNTSEFMPIGLLTDIASSFGIAGASAGAMITVYAWAVMLLSLPLMIAASRIEFKRLLLGVLAVFAVGQGLSAAAPTFAILVVARIVVAYAHAIFWSIASVMATRLVSTRHAPTALGMIATGTSIAMILGMPLGRAIGLALGWRMAFAAVGTVSVVVTLYLAIVLPGIPTGNPFTLGKLPALARNGRLMVMYAVTVLFATAYVVTLYLAIVLPGIPTGNPFTLGKLPALARNGRLMVMYAVTVLFATAYYTGYSYIEPFLAQVGGMEPSSITVALTVFGCAGLMGSFLFSRVYGGRRRAFLACSVGGMVVALFALRACAPSFAATGAVFVVWGCCATAFNVAFQSEVIRAVEADESSVAMSIFSGLFNFGIGAGSALGGFVVTGLSVGLLGVVGGAVGVVCLLLTVGVLFRLMR